MKLRSLTLLASLIVLVLLVNGPAVAQEEEELKISLKKNFGYAAGSQLQGTFTIRATGPEELNRVVFLIDNAPLGEANSSPFQYQFNTDNYALGNHTLTSIGYTQNGAELHSQPILVEFVSADAGWKNVLNIILPIFGVILVAMLLSFIVPQLLGRGKVKELPLGAPRNYGVLGGTICPNCHRPFGMHLYGVNLLLGKLDRCPYCGRWSLVRRAFPDQLAAAEAAELELAMPGELIQVQSEEEKMLRDLEESRYQDL